MFHGIRFEFNRAIGKLTHDYDLRIWCPNGRVVFADTKCKEELNDPSETTILHSLQRARRQLPPHSPGFVFIKVPRHWIEDVGYAESISRIARKFMTGTGRVVAVKYYVTSVPYDAQSMAEVISAHEVTTERIDHGKGIDWHLFPNPPTDTEALLSSGNWYRLR
jgi:hypothetical protein